MSPTVPSLRAVSLRPEESELEPLADELLSAMSAIRRSGRRLAGRPDELSALTGSQLELVKLVRRRPGVSVTEAADALHLVPNTVSTLVRQLCDLGFLVRRRDESDGRVARLELTEEMGRKVGAFRDRKSAVLVDAIQQLSVADRRRLRAMTYVLTKLQYVMEEATA